MPRESHQNEAGRFHRSVAFCLRSSRNIALTKIHFKYFLGLYSLEKEHKIAKINLGLSHRPCFDDSFPGPEREQGIMHSVYRFENKDKPTGIQTQVTLLSHHDYQSVYF